MAGRTGATGVMMLGRSPRKLVPLIAGAVRGLMFGAAGMLMLAADGIVSGAAGVGTEMVGIVGTACIVGAVCVVASSRLKSLLIKPASLRGADCD